MSRRSIQRYVAAGHVLSRVTVSGRCLIDEPSLVEYLSQSRCGGGEFTPKEDNPVNEDNVAEEVQALSEQIEALTIQVWSLASGEQSTRGQKAPSGKEIASHQANLPARKQRAGVAAKGRRVVARKTQLRGKIRPTCLREDAPLGDCLG